MVDIKVEAKDPPDVKKMDKTENLVVIGDGHIAKDEVKLLYDQSSYTVAEQKADVQQQLEPKPSIGSSTEVDKVL
jgi:hypothetical protein